MKTLFIVSSASSQGQEIEEKLNISWSDQIAPSFSPFFNPVLQTFQSRSRHKIIRATFNLSFPLAFRTVCLYQHASRGTS